MTTMPNHKYSVTLSLTEQIELCVLLERHIRELRESAIYLDSDVFKAHLRNQAGILQKLSDQLNIKS
jgi:hypothetical protein